MVQASDPGALPPGEAWASTQLEPGPYTARQNSHPNRPVFCGAPIERLQVGSRKCGRAFHSRIFRMKRFPEEACEVRPADRTSS